MNMQAVTSSNISAIGYDAQTKTLAISFTNGTMYNYHGVPVETWNGLESASSKGAYFAQNIKKMYSATKVAVSMQSLG